ncbi:hypothetical protein ACSBR2_037930 [Camellia fascicularis]
MKAVALLFEFERRRVFRVVIHGTISISLSAATQFHSSSFSFFTLPPHNHYSSANETSISTHEGGREEEEEPKSLCWRIEKLPRTEPVGSTFQSWMGDRFPIHRGHVFHTINRLRKLHFNKRALESAKNLCSLSVCLYASMNCSSCIIRWTFSLITIYFGLGSLLSMYGCHQYHNKVGGDRTEDFDVEQGTNSNESNGEKHLESNQKHRVRQTARFWGYIFQIVFQLIINMQTINAVFLLGDTALNCLRFPWFRIVYFFLWTAVYVHFKMDRPCLRFALVAIPFS